MHRFDPLCLPLPLNNQSYFRGPSVLLLYDERAVCDIPRQHQLPTTTGMIKKQECYFRASLLTAVGTREGTSSIIFSQAPPFTIVNKTGSALPCGKPSAKRLCPLKLHHLRNSTLFITPFPRMQEQFLKPNGGFQIETFSAGRAHASTAEFYTALFHCV